MKREENSQKKLKNIDISIVDIFILIIPDSQYLKEICTSSKSFLSVINKPILFYQLEFLERQGINKVKILANKDYIVIKQALDNYKGPIKYEFIELKEKLGLGLFDAIKSNLDYKNFILIEGDSILSFNLWDMIDNHIDNNNLLSLVLQQKADANYLKKFREKTVNIFGIDLDDNNRVVYYAKQNMDDHRNISIKKEILSHCKRMNLLFKYIDIGLYIFNDSIFDILKSPKFKEKTSKLNFESIKEAFIPYLIKQTFSKTLNMILIENYKNQLLKAKRVKISAKLIQNSDDINSEFCYKIYDYPSYLQIIKEIQKPYEQIKPIFFQTKNNSKNYFSNFKDKIIDNLTNNKKFNEEIPELSLISDDTYIADVIKSIEEGAKINKSVVDKNLKIDKNSEIINCIIGLDAEIGKNCEIKNCIIGDNAKIADESKISECIIGESYNFTNEKKIEVSEQILY